MPLPDTFARALADRFGKRFSTAEAVRTHHGHDESHFSDALPDGVVWPHSTAEVAEIVNLCREHRVPLIPFGVGSSLEGHILATHGGLSIDLSEMKQVVTIHDEDMDAVVQPGVTRKTLNAALHGSGLFFPIDPGADASLGGMASTRASGTNAVRYGTMRENVLGLEVVLADGRVIRTGGRSRKSSAGYDLTRLFVGSEGTLGIITELTVRLHPLPEAVSSATCAFPDVASAVRTVIQTIQLGVPVARIELLDALTVQAVNRYSKTTLRETPMLFFEFHGSPTGVEEQARTVQDIARDNGGQDFEWATRPEDRSRLWQARHDVLFASLNLLPGCRGISTDVCVPISRLRSHRRRPARHRPKRPHRPHRRPRGRRQLPRRDPHHAGRPGPGSRLRRTRPAHRRTRPRPRRHLHRRTWHRHRQARVPARRTRRRGGRDAEPQSRPRSAEPDEPRQDLCPARLSATPAHASRAIA